MREIDDAHDAEDEVQAESDEREVEPEDETGDEGVDQHEAGARRFPLTPALSRKGRG